MKIVVTGGSGGLGREIMTTLVERGSPGVPASRRTGVDLATGEGLTGVLAGVDIIIHAASHPLRYRQVDLEGTRRMIKVLAELGRRPHIVYVSIVGCDRIRYPYYRAKCACELVLHRSGLPVTIIRATQFHPLVRSLCRAVTLGPVAIVPRAFTFQPCDPRWVAEQITDCALGAPPSGLTRANDLAGPERVTLSEALEKLVLRENRPMPKVWGLPTVGATLKGFAAGGNLPDEQARIGGLSFSDWLGH